MSCIFGRNVIKQNTGPRKKIASWKANHINESYNINRQYIYMLYYHKAGDTWHVTHVQERTKLGFLNKQGGGRLNARFRRWCEVASWCLFSFLKYRTNLVY